MTKRLRVYKGGRPAKIKNAKDLGTPELIFKRSLMGGKDPAKCTCPLDALKERGTISNDAYDAADHWARIRGILFGSPFPGAVDLLAIGGGRMGDNMDRSEMEARYFEACADLIRISRQTFTVVENVAFFQRWPQWMFETGTRRNKDKERLFCGFGVLIGWRSKIRKAA